MLVINNCKFPFYGGSFTGEEHALFRNGWKGDRKGAGACSNSIHSIDNCMDPEFPLIRALSRYREFAADRGSAIITGQPSHLCISLMTISGVMERVPSRDLREVEAMNAFFIIQQFPVNLL